MACYPNGHRQTVVVVLALHVAVAVLFLITGIAQLATVEQHWSSRVAFGLWGSVWIFLTALLGYLSVRRNGANNQNNSSTCYIATHMSFSIVSTVMVGIFLIVFGLALSEFNGCLDCRYVYNFFTYNYRRYCPYYGLRTLDQCRTGKGLASFTLALLLLEFVLSILSAILCCSAVCCGRQQQNTGQVVVVPVGGGVGQMQGGAVVGQVGQVTYIQQGQVPTVVPGANVPPTMQVVQQGPQYYPQPHVQASTAQESWNQVPPPAYSVPMATGVTPTQSAGPLPQKN